VVIRPFSGAGGEYRVMDGILRMVAELRDSHGSLVSQGDYPVVGTHISGETSNIGPRPRWHHTLADDLQINLPMRTSIHLPGSCRLKENTEHFTDRDLTAAPFSLFSS